MPDDVLSNKKVAEFATVSGEWNWERLGQVLPKDCLDNLMPNKAHNHVAGLTELLGFLLYLETLI